MSVEKNTIVHIFCGFLGSGKTTAIRHLLSQKDSTEKWYFIINEFGKIGIDGAVLKPDQDVVSEVTGGCLCCVAGAEMAEAVHMLLHDYPHPDRLIIEASGLAHGGSIIDSINRLPEKEQLTIGATITLIDPRQYLDDNYRLMPLYRDQVIAGDVLLINKAELCSEQVVSDCLTQCQHLFPSKAGIHIIPEGKPDISYLNTPPIIRGRYRLKREPSETLHYHSEAFVFPPDVCFDMDKLSVFLAKLPQWCTNLVRAKGIFHVNDLWLWVNWTVDNWGANETAWRHDNRFELIAEYLDISTIEDNLNSCIIYKK